MFLFAVAFGTAAAYIANRWIDQRMASDTTETSNTSPVVVAALAIPFGQQIDEAHVRVIQWPRDGVLDGSFESTDEVINKVANQRIMPGEVVLESRIVDHASGSTLSSIIAPNKRALTVRVNDVIGVAGFLLPGNHVDVIASHSSHSKNNYTHTHTILRNLKVLAVDQSVSADKEKPVVVRAVTLEVTPKQAERLVQATEVGSVQLALRNPNDIDEPESQRKVVKKARVKSKVVVKKKQDGAITIIRGTKVDVTRIKL
jgi:pilus assembly protein CpaB